MSANCTKSEAKKERASLPVLPVKTAPIAKSKTSRWRAGALIALNLLMILHIIQWRLMGTTVSPIEPSESMYTLQNGAVNAGFIFFTLAILATLIFGRFVCGWGCHIVALQDLCAWLLKKAGLKPVAFRSRLLIYIPLITALYMFVWPTIARALTKPESEPLFPAFTNHLITNDFWATFPPVWVAIPFLFIVGFVTVYFLGSKGFCTYGCPYGGFFAVADKFAPGKIRVTDACEHCGHCTSVCTSNVKVHQEVKKYGMVVDPGCMKCMDCVSVCPNDALYFGYGKPSIAIKKEGSGNYSLTWPEEIAGTLIFIASFFAVWNVYQVVPMLMAIGIAIITTFLALKSWRLLGVENSAFYARSLRTGGRFTLAGAAFLFFSAGWIFLNIHSGFIRYHESAGNQAYDRLQIPDELALAQADPREWLDAVAQDAVARGTYHFRQAARYGFISNVDAMPRLAWMEFLSGDAESAEMRLEETANLQSGPSQAISLYYRGAILNRLGQPIEALKSLDEAIALRPDLLSAKEEMGEALWRSGHRAEAAAIWAETLKTNDSLPIATKFAAGAYLALGDPEHAKNLDEKGDILIPADPYFHWVIGRRLENLGMNSLAEKHFAKAVQLNPAFELRRLNRRGDQK